MCSTRVLALLAMFVGLAESFSWDVVVGGKEKRLEFYYNGILTHTENIPSAQDITGVTYDPIHDRVLFVDYYYPTARISISSFDLSTRNVQSILTKKANGFLISRIIYDPVTQLIFWIDGYSIYSFSLNPASSNQAVDGNLVVTLDRDCTCRDMAVDSCGGYIYWITDYEIERARLDGSEREVLILGTVYRMTVAIDHQTQKIYWTELIYGSSEIQLSIESADFNGKNKYTVYFNKTKIYTRALTISKDSIYLISTTDLKEMRIWQLPKRPTGHLERNIRLITESDCSACHSMAANYTLKDQIQGIKRCEAVQLFSSDSKSECTVAICQNYYLHGNCSVNAEGQPKCSCEAGYSGERCEINVCHNHCSNNGICSLNEEDQPVCECTADYEGERCDVAITLTSDHADNKTQQVLQDLRSEVKHLKRILEVFSDKIDEYEAKI